MQHSVAYRPYQRQLPGFSRLYSGELRYLTDAQGRRLCSHCKIRVAQRKYGRHGDWRRKGVRGNICNECKAARKRGLQFAPSIQKKRKTSAERNKARRLKLNPYLMYRLDWCEECGFVAQVIGQLEVDHIDGNHQNNEPSNLRTLCANCHRLKTAQERGLLNDVY